MVQGNQCPSANGKTRERLLRVGPELPQLAQRLKVKVLIGPLVLPEEHVSLIVVEAQNYETVQDLVMQSGLIQWNTVKISGAIHLDEVAPQIEKMPPPLY